jgi:hypothetical protein
MAFIDITELAHDDSSECGGVMTADGELGDVTVTSIGPGEEGGDILLLFAVPGAVAPSVLSTAVSTLTRPVLVHFL